MLLELALYFLAVQVIPASTSCSNSVHAHPWIPIELGTVGWAVNVGVAKIAQGFTIPSSVPNNATEILVYATAAMGHCHPNTRAHAHLYTEVDNVKYSYYLQCMCYPGQNAWNTNSENFWFPIGQSHRKLYVYMPVGLYNNVGMRVYVTGYKVPIARTSSANSTGSPTAAVEPAQQRPWTTIELGPVWPVNVGAAQTAQSWNIPSSVPGNASEVLVYTTAAMGNCNPNTRAHAQIYTEIDTIKYSYYIQLMCYPGQNAWNTNSDNFWLLIGPERKVYAYMPVGLHKNVGMKVYFIGYK